MLSLAAFESSAQEIYLVREIDPEDTFETEPIPFDMAPVGNRVFFTTVIHPDLGPPNQFIGWASDGSWVGTLGPHPIFDFNGVVSPGLGVATGGVGILNQQMYFMGYDPENFIELWRTDGTPEGTGLFKVLGGQVFPGSDPDSFARLGDLLLFSADDFTRDRELWMTDGTVDGTTLLKNISPENSSHPSNLRTVGTLVYFSAGDDVAGIEPFISDGTADGTTLLKDINPEGSSSPENFTESGELVFFTAGTAAEGIELWKTDGTGAETTMVKNINPGSLDEANISQLTNINGLLLFSADDGTNGQELWRSDGTLAGTSMVKDIAPAGNSSPSEITALNGLAVFAAESTPGDRQLWVSGGNPDGSDTSEIEINPGGSAEPAHFARLGGKVYFTADDGTNGRELWCTDSTAEGTTMVRDLNPGAAGSDPQTLTAAGGRLFFFADEGNGLGFELYALVVDLPHLGNISTRGAVGTGDEVMIGGFIIEGGRKQVLIRGRGPSLDPFNVPNTLDDPFLQIFDGATLIASNDDWQDTQEAEIQATGAAPTVALESAVLIELDEGAYTAILSGGTGIGIVEVIEVK